MVSYKYIMKLGLLADCKLKVMNLGSGIFNYRRLNTGHFNGSRCIPYAVVIILDAPFSLMSVSYQTLRGFELLGSMSKEFSIFEIVLRFKKIKFLARTSQLHACNNVSVQNLDFSVDVSKNVSNAAVTTTIRLRFDGRSTTIRLFIKGHYSHSNVVTH